MIVSFLFMLVVAAIIVFPLWKILERLGYSLPTREELQQLSLRGMLRRLVFSPFLSLAFLLPFLNIGLLYFIAFTDWPVEGSAAPPEDT